MRHHQFLVLMSTFKWHHSEVLACDMMFSVFVPPQAEHGPVPVLFWLAGKVGVRLKLFAWRDG